MYGRDLFVSPVIRPGIKEMRVYLPSDDWVHVWSGARFSGGFAEVDAPVGMPPVFYRAGSGFSGIFEALRSL
jgi:alpha-glucosidase